MKEGDKVKVIDRRDGEVVFTGELVVANEAENIASVRGTYNESAFGGSQDGTPRTTTISVPLSCVEKGGEL